MTDQGSVRSNLRTSSQHHSRSHLFLILLSLLAFFSDSNSVQAEKKVALLVGINQCDVSSLKLLHYAERDVVEISKNLDTLGFDVHVLTGKDATKANIIESIEKLLSPLGKDDLFFLMLSGHGLVLDLELGERGTAREAYYCPTDANVVLPSSLLSFRKLIDDVLPGSPARKIWVIDASRTPETHFSSARNGFQLEKLTSSNTLTIFSCEPNETSHESAKLGHGVFAHCLINCLQGKGSIDSELRESFLIKQLSKEMSHERTIRILPNQDTQSLAIKGWLSDRILGNIPEEVLAEIKNSSEWESQYDQPAIFRFLGGDRKFVMVARPEGILNMPVVLDTLKLITRTSLKTSWPETVKNFRESTGLSRVIVESCVLLR